MTRPGDPRILHGHLVLTGFCPSRPASMSEVLAAHVGIVGHEQLIDIARDLSWPTSEMEWLICGHSRDGIRAQISAFLRAEATSVRFAPALTRLRGLEKSLLRHRSIQLKDPRGAAYELVGFARHG